MNVATGLLAVGALLITLIATGLVYYALWRGRHALPQLTPDRLRRAFVGAALMLIPILGAAAVAIIAPWGGHSFAYVILAVAAIYIPLSLISLFVQARRDARKASNAREARRQERG